MAVLHYFMHVIWLVFTKHERKQVKDVEYRYKPIKYHPARQWQFRVIQKCAGVLFLPRDTTLFI